MQQGSSSVSTPTETPNGANSTAGLTDEQILGLEPVPTPQPSATRPSRHSKESARFLADDEESLLALDSTPQRDSSGRQTGSRNDGAENSSGPRPGQAGTEDPSDSTAPPESTDAATQAAATANDAAEPAWLKALDAHPEAAAEARQWRDAARNVASIDAAYFSAEPGARTGLAARLHQDDPAAFRAMLADAARVLATRDPQGLAELARQLGAVSGPPWGDSVAPSGAAKSIAHAVAQGARPGVGRGPEDFRFATGGGVTEEPQGPSANGADGTLSYSNPSSGASAFPASVYREFAAATNGAVEHEVRSAIDRTLSATLPDGLADGARRRIGDDVFREVHRALSADRDLSARIGELMRGWQFDEGAGRQAVALLAGRARNVLPDVARRVVSEWTSSVLASDRAKNARIESAASRRDITGGRLPEAVASSALLPRRVDYNRTSDEQILEM